MPWGSASSPRFGGGHGIWSHACEGSTYLISVAVRILPTRRPRAGAQVARKPIVPLLLKRVLIHVMPKPYCLLQTQLFSLCERIRILILCQFFVACDVAFVPSYF